MDNNIFPFPQQAESAAAWRTFLNQPQAQDPAELLSYVYRLYERERVLSTRYHQILLAFAHLADGYNPTNEAAKANVLTQCVDCAQSVVVDGAEYGRFLPCGHVMHSFCMATYCDPQESTSAPGCRRCGVRFFPSLCRPESQLQVAEVLSAVRVLEGSSLEKLRQDYLDNGMSASTTSELHRLILQPQHDEAAICQQAETVIVAHKKFLRELAQTVAEKLIPTITEPRPFPPLPERLPERPLSERPTEPATKKPCMPPTLEPDILPPVGTVILKGTRFKNKSIMFTAFSSKCKQCKRAQEQGRSVIAAGEQGFACTICVFGMTSAAVCEEYAKGAPGAPPIAAAAPPSVDSMF